MAKWRNDHYSRPRKRASADVPRDPHRDLVAAVPQSVVQRHGGAEGRLANTDEQPTDDDAGKVVAARLGCGRDAPRQSAEGEGFVGADDGSEDVAGDVAYLERGVMESSETSNEAKTRQKSWQLEGHVFATYRVGDVERCQNNGILRIGIAAKDAEEALKLGITSVASIQAGWWIGMSASQTGAVIVRSCE